MRSKCLFILTLITGICFVLSALEINTDSIKNTFDDEYDHYLQPDKTPIHATVIQFFKDHQPDSPGSLFDNNPFSWFPPVQSCFSGNFIAQNNYVNSSKIYLLYGLLRI